nr:tetraspanin [Hymenolepis microstoma]
MALSCGKKMLVGLSVIFNSIFFLCGLTLIGFASYLLYSLHSTFPDIKLHEYGFVIAFLVFGIIVCVLSFLGCCGAATGNVCMLTTYAILIAVIFILDIVAIILGFIYKDRIPTLTRSILTSELEKFKNGSGLAMEAIESVFSCCGVDGPSDYGTNISQNCESFSEGCDAKIQDYIIRYSVILFIIALSIAIFTLATIVSAACVVSGIKAYTPV